MDLGVGLRVLSLLGFLFLLHIPGSESEVCNVREEGTPSSIYCSTSSAFETFGHRLTIDDADYDTVSCDMSGNCTSVDPSRFTPVFTDSITSWKVTLLIGSVNRTMGGTYCLRDGVRSTSGCEFDIYVRPSELVCEGPVFESEGTEAVYTCTSDRVYPDGVCTFKDVVANKTLIHTTTTNTDSSVYEGDKSVECETRIAVTGKDAGTYTYTATIYPDVYLERLDASGIKTTDNLQPLTLIKTTLYNPLESGHVYGYPESGFLSMEIEVTGNPPPNRFSLSVRTDETSTSTTVFKEYYSVQYTPSTGSADGVISLNITEGLNRLQTSYYDFSADNGVVGSGEFEYMFTVLNGIDNEDDSILSQCGVYEEGSYHTFSCSTKSEKFDSYGPWFEIHGMFRKVAACNSGGVCYSDDPARYSVQFFFMDGRREVHVGISNVNSSITAVKCYMDDLPLHGVECDTSVYAVPTKPECTGPLFEDEDTASYTCTSYRILPSGRCDYTLTDGDRLGLVDVHVSTNNEESTVSGYTSTTCKLEITITGSTTGSYKFITSITPDLEGVPAGAQVFSDVLPSLSLSQTALYDPNESGHVYDHPTSGSLNLEIHWTGNPEPNRFSLSVRYDETSDYTPVSSSFYLTSIGADSDVLNLDVMDGGYDPERDSFFRFRADNGIVGGDGFEYMFTIRSPSGGGEEPESHKHDSGDDNLPLIIGVVLGVVIFVGVIVIILLVLRMRKKRNMPNNNMNNDIHLYDMADTVRMRESNQYGMASGLPPAPHFPPPYQPYNDTKGQESREQSAIYIEPFDPPTDEAPVPSGFDNPGAYGMEDE